MTHAHATIILYHWNKSSFPGRVKTNEVLIAEKLLSDPSFGPAPVKAKNEKQEIKERKTAQERRWVSREFQGMCQRQSTYYYNFKNGTQLKKKEFLELCKDESFRLVWAPMLNIEMVGI